MPRRTALVAAVTFVVALASHAATIDEPFDRTFDVRPGSVFFLSNTNGRVTVHAWDEPRVRVQAEKRVRGAGDAARAAMTALKIEVSQPNGGLRVVTRYPKGDGAGFFDWMFGEQVSASVSYDVTVPRAMSVEVENTN